MTETNTGARPIGATDEASVASTVRSMFDGIAPRYDLLNHLLSFGIDSLWRRRVARTYRHILDNPDSRIIDLCCGTGDLSLAFERWRPEHGAPIIAADFSHEMLIRAQRKFTRKNIHTLEADAMHLPLPDASVDLIVSAFGFRNLANYQRALEEIYRVLAPGGQIGIFEAAEPRGLFGAIYRLYFHRIVPRIGAVISRDARAYQYLPASVQSFPTPPHLLDAIRSVGFVAASWTPYSLGIAGLFRAAKASRPAAKSL